MAKMKEQHPTLFVWEGSVRYYEEGSMLELHTQLSKDEWESIIEQTIQYKVFLECLKKIAFPILKEKWDKQDEWFRLQMDIAVSRMRNIDPLFVAKFDQKEMTKIYSDKMKKNANETVELIDQMRKQKHDMFKEQYDADINVSDL